MSNSKTLSWNDRFALLDHFKPSDADACSAFGVTQSELDTARDMRTAGAFTASPDVDVASYSTMFGIQAAPKTASASTSSTSATPSKSSTTTTKAKKSGATSITKTGKSGGAKPETATKKVKEPKKRGRKGDKIANAFAAIPASPTPVEAFASSNNVSLAVLRQSKRFDPNPDLGTVHVKKDKESGTLMIWREATA